MVEQVFGALFVAAFFVPAAFVAIGVVLVVWPRREAARHQPTLPHARTAA